MSKVKDLTNQKFGKLKVIKRDESRKGRAAYWLCECECGRSPILSVRGQNLRENRRHCCDLCRKENRNVIR